MKWITHPKEVFSLLPQEECGIDLHPTENSSPGELLRYLEATFTHCTQPINLVSIDVSEVILTTALVLGLVRLLKRYRDSLRTLNVSYTLLDVEKGARILLVLPPRLTVLHITGIPRPAIEFPLLSELQEFHYMENEIPITAKILHQMPKLRRLCASRIESLGESAYLEQIMIEYPYPHYVRELRDLPRFKESQFTDTVPLLEIEQLKTEIVQLLTKRTRVCAVLATARNCPHHCHSLFTRLPDDLIRILVAMLFG